MTRPILDVIPILRAKTMENILENIQYTQQERANILFKAYNKKEFDLVLYYHYQVTSAELTNKEKDVI